MEVDSIIEMFSRSEALHNVKYCTCTGDRNGKTLLFKKNSALTMC